MQGLQVTLGANLLPLLTQGANLLNSVAVPAFQGMAEWVTKNQGTFTALGNILRWVWNNVLLPLVKGAIWGFAAMNKPLAQAVQALGALTGNKDLETFGAGLVQAADDAMTFANSLQGIPDEVAPKIDPKVEQAKTKLGEVKDRIKGLKDKIVTAKAKGDDKGLRDLKKKLADAKKEQHTLKAIVKGSVDPGTDTIKLSLARGGKTGLLKFAARGGYVPPGWTVVGEEGAELIRTTRTASVMSAARTRQVRSQPIALGAAAGGDTYQFVFNGVLTEAQAGAVFERGLVRLKASRRGRKLAFES